MRRIRSGRATAWSRSRVPEHATSRRWFSATAIPNFDVASICGGSFEPGETAEQVALREAEEETDLRGVSGVRYLGSRLFESRTWTSLLFHRHFFLLPVARHDVPYGSHQRPPAPESLTLTT